MENNESKRNRNKEILASFFFHFFIKFHFAERWLRNFQKKNEKLNYIVRIDIETRNLS